VGPATRRLCLGSRWLALSTARLVAPIPRPRRNLFCVGWNYSEHLRGPGLSWSERQSAGSARVPGALQQAADTVVGPEAPVWHSAPVSNELDWEVELAVIVGAPGRDISEERAYEHVFGYTVGNDVSVRDVQRRHVASGSRARASIRTPAGPLDRHRRRAGDPHSLHITLRVNGVTKQDSNTRFMVFRIPRIVKSCRRGSCSSR